MKAVIVYESEFGATRLVAQAIELGLGERMHTELMNVHDTAHFSIGREDLLVVGAPTHGRTGVREWLATIELDGSWCASFATRAHMSLLLSGSAAPGILRSLRNAGGVKLAPPVAFLRYAQDWGRQLGAAMEGAPGTPALARH